MFCMAAGAAVSQGSLAMQPAHFAVKVGHKSSLCQATSIWTLEYIVNGLWGLSVLGLAGHISVQQPFFCVCQSASSEPESPASLGSNSR